MPLVNHKEFQSVVMEQRQTQQLLQEASASLKRFYVKEAHSWWWDDPFVSGSGEEKAQGFQLVSFKTSPPLG